MLFSETELRQLINQYYSLDPNPESPYPAGFLHEKMLPAAVLIPMMMKEDAWHLLFIRRTFQKNDRHGGQVAMLFLEAADCYARLLDVAPGSPRAQG